MTTKKKSLLGIGCLSVAMLSASLLMVKPVSADEDGALTSAVVTDGQLSTDSESQILLPPPSETDAPSQSYTDGYAAGVQAAQEGNEDAISVPDNTVDKDDYEAGYIAGFRDNSHSAFVQFFIDAWHWFIQLF